MTSEEQENTKVMAEQQAYYVERAPEYDEWIGPPQKILSLSFFRDEEAVRQWRSLAAHRSAQAKGRGGIFPDYRLRVADVIRDYGMHERKQVPADSMQVHDL